MFFFVCFGFGIALLFALYGLCSVLSLCSDLVRSVVGAGMLNATIDVARSRSAVAVFALLVCAASVAAARFMLSSLFGPTYEMCFVPAPAAYFAVVFGPFLSLCKSPPKRTPSTPFLHTRS